MSLFFSLMVITWPCCSLIHPSSAPAMICLDKPTPRACFALGFSSVALVRSPYPSHVSLPLSC